jgi:hypothetical protein
VNKDGQYTGPNGKWDADTILWTQARVVYTGHPAFGADASGNLFSRFFALGTPPAATPRAPPFSVAVGATQSYGVFFADENLNPMSAFTTYAVRSALGNVNPVLVGPDVAIDTLGARFRLLYCDQPQAPATCFEGTADEACRTSPCYVVPDLALCSTGTCTGFIYGNTAEVIIKGVSVGSDRVEASTAQEGVTTSILLPGTCVAGP